VLSCSQFHQSTLTFRLLSSSQFHHSTLSLRTLTHLSSIPLASDDPACVRSATSSLKQLTRLYTADNTLTAAAQKHVDVVSNFAHEIALRRIRKDRYSSDDVRYLPCAPSELALADSKYEGRTKTAVDSVGVPANDENDDLDDIDEDK